MFRVTSFAVGAAAFSLAHAVTVVAWRAVFAPAGDLHAPWFLNSGRAVAFTAACLFAAAFGYTLLAKSIRSRWLVAVAHLVAGAVFAMAVVLAMIGPGTIFPLALAVGGLIASVSSASGGYLGTRL